MEDLDICGWASAVASASASATNIITGIRESNCSEQSPPPSPPTTPLSPPPSSPQSPSPPPPLLQSKSQPPKSILPPLTQEIRDDFARHTKLCNNGDDDSTKRKHIREERRDPPYTCGVPLLLLVLLFLFAIGVGAYAFVISSNKHHRNDLIQPPYATPSVSLPQLQTPVPVPEG